MAGSRKRRGSPGLSSSSAYRQRLSLADADRSGAMRAVAAVLMVIGMMSVGIHAVTESHTPRPRQSIYEPRRLNWDEHVLDLEGRGEHCFKRYYRMEKDSFHKLAELLRPRLEPNPHFGALRSVNGAVSVEIRLAVALRMMAGASYMDVAIIYGVGFQTVYQILWGVVDTINDTPTVGPFIFPQTVQECRRNADKWQALSTNGVFANVVAAVDGLLIKTKAPSPSETANVLAYYSGSKSGYGINVQASCDANMRFCQMSAIAPGSTNDWNAWNRSTLATAVSQLPEGFCILGDAAYPLSERLLTPYPGKGLDPGYDSFNFHLSQLRVRIEQSFGILVSVWGILWRPLKVQFAGRTNLITALFHLHNFLRDERDEPIDIADEDDVSGLGRPQLTADGGLSPDWRTAPAPSRSGETNARADIRYLLQEDTQWRPVRNKKRNS